MTFAVRMNDTEGGYRGANSTFENVTYALALTETLHNFSC